MKVKRTITEKVGPRISAKTVARRIRIQAMQNTAIKVWRDNFVYRYRRGDFFLGITDSGNAWQVLSLNHRKAMALLRILLRFLASDQSAVLWEYQKSLPVNHEDTKNRKRGKR